MGDIENTVMASGKVKPIYSVDVGAQVSGRIVKLYVDVGDEVKKGDLIAQINQVEQKTPSPMQVLIYNKPKRALPKPKQIWRPVKAMWQAQKPPYKHALPNSKKPNSPLLAWRAF
ncbi:biotin/lipoyl-binding protein [Moraxella bovis]|uniref:biotin/lipoyl-binding protein n=1 Tax=Moraxella bovis TaxID=476 RepID=UPI0022262529|nr:biotin/lipoyl-binding protein [Moraxella bovis]UYZ69142.1 biotin/lipoyl-binding protein [Moraxella bovis]UYZ71515.1 biotin/lipoyl-binding protein [Moraxella bovis]UYZ72571.1 biotin/lipoyl-binding protein [Moraxella bovis]UZA14810.1 biotin/lipoyl-binding protein [Moraxella bovis]UZA26828.1 biotin/lipoyl-binding protein [Moraxella bovis]